MKALFLSFNLCLCVMLDCLSSHNMQEKRRYKQMFCDFYIWTYLKLGCGLMEGICPSMTPLSLIVSSPFGSNRAFSLSNTEGL